MGRELIISRARAHLRCWLAVIGGRGIEPDGYETEATARIGRFPLQAQSPWLPVRRGRELISWVETFDYRRERDISMRAWRTCEENS